MKPEHCLRKCRLFNEFMLWRVKMIDKLDGANVLLISDKGSYYYAKNLDLDDAGIEICYFAICRYDNDSKIFLFSCDENMSVERDSDFDSIDKAVECAERWSKCTIKWSHLVFDELFSKLEEKYGEDFNWMHMKFLGEETFLKELDKELNENHPLYKKVQAALAKCESNDDVLFLLRDDNYAIVHLTWSGSRETTSRFPYYKEFSNLQSALAHIENEFISKFL